MGMGWREGGRRDRIAAPTGRRTRGGRRIPDGAIRSGRLSRIYSLLIHARGRAWGSRMAIKLHRRYLCLHCQNVCFRRRMRKKGCSCLGRPTYSAWGCGALGERGCASMTAAPCE